MTKIIYNADLPSITKIKKSLLKNVEIKNNYRLITIKDFLTLEKDNQALIKLIKSCPLKNTRKNILIDIKIQDFKVGEYTCPNTKYHLDGKGYIKPRDVCNDNIYHICILEGPPTLFIKHPFGYTFSNKVQQEKLIKDLGINYMVHTTIPIEAWNTYGEFHWHKGRKIFVDCKRVFIKITESNYIKGVKYS